jgi:uncharacterized protein YndB with AHSA1/START domain
MVGQSGRPVGLTKDAGWEIGVRRTLMIPHESAWELVTSPAGLRIWLGTEPDFRLAEGATYRLEDGTTGVVRVYVPMSHVRLTWHPPGWPRASTIQVRVLPKDDRAVVAFHQEHLPGPTEREQRRAHFTAALDELKRMLKQ